MRFLSTWIALVSLGVASAADFVFSTRTIKHDHQKALRRQRRAKVDVKQVAAEALEDSSVTDEDKAFWDRMLEHHLSIVTDPPVAAPVAPPDTPAPCPVIVSFLVLRWV